MRDPLTVQNQGIKAGKDDIPALRWHGDQNDVPRREGEIVTTLLIALLKLPELLLRIIFAEGGEVYPLHRRGQGG